MANTYDTNLILQSIASAITNAATSDPNLLAKLQAIADAITNGGGGGSVTASNVSVVPTSPFVSTNLQNLSVEEANAITANAGDITTINTALGNTSISSIGDGTVTGAISTIYNSLGKLLWTNPLSGNSFSGQTIYIDLSQYDAVIVIAYLYATQAYAISETCLVGESGAFTSFSGNGGLLAGAPVLLARTFSVTSSGVQFSDGIFAPQNGNFSTLNEGIIPKHIIGIKFQS